MLYLQLQRSSNPPLLFALVGVRAGGGILRDKGRREGGKEGTSDIKQKNKPSEDGGSGRSNSIQLSLSYLLLFQYSALLL